MISPEELKFRVKKYSSLGLCMFAPATMAGIVNRKLNFAYGDSGDNLTVPLGRVASGNIVKYWGGNYSSAPITHALATVDVFSDVPGCVLLLTEPGVGASFASVVGLIEHGVGTVDISERHSFFSFADSHFGIERLDHPSEIIDGFAGFDIQLVGLALTPHNSIQHFFVTPWEAIFREIIDDPKNLYTFSNEPRKFEEFIAESYRRAGYKVLLTPSSGDGGVDIIAELSGHGAIKILDQTKAYSAHRPVPANDVRALVGVLSRYPDASKAVITTTSTFAPGVYKEFEDMTPTRLELRDGQRLIDWLKTLKQP